MDNVNTGLLAMVTQVSDIGIVIFGVIVVVLSAIGAIQSGVLSRRKIPAPPMSRAVMQEVECARSSGVLAPPEASVPPPAPAASKVAESAEEEEAPFETEQLASYYSQVLTQSKISFWFSLVFASIGFLIIVLAAFLYSKMDTGSAIARFIAGGVIDAIAALFFVQSNRAHASMADFFEKLRRDRHHFEARKLCESIESASARDALRIRLALHYAEVASSDAIAESIIGLSSTGNKKL